MILRYRFYLQNILNKLLINPFPVSWLPTLRFGCYKMMLACPSLFFSFGTSLPFPTSGIPPSSPQAAWLVPGRDNQKVISEFGPAEPRSWSDNRDKLVASPRAPRSKFFLQKNKNSSCGKSYHPTIHSS